MKYSFEDIARYAEQEMPAEERQAFEAALGTDAELQQQLALYREVDSNLQQQFTPDAQREQLKNTLQGMRSEFFAGKADASTDSTANTKAPAKVVSMNRYLKAAVSIAAVLVIGLFVWNPFNGDLYEQYSPTTMVTQVERGGHTDSVLNEATVAFNGKEFTTAAVLLAEVVQQQPDNSFANFYFAVSLLESGQTRQSREVLTKVYNGTSAFKYEAAFYLALSYIKAKDEAAAKGWLEKIPADAGNYAKAQEVLKKL
jgi:Tfp pilus assembly protein PilF